MASRALAQCGAGQRKNIGADDVNGGGTAPFREDGMCLRDSDLGQQVLRSFLGNDPHYHSCLVGSTPRVPRPILRVLHE